MPNQDLIQTIKDHKDELINNICNRLQNLTASHYETIDFESHEEREKAVLHSLLESLKASNTKVFIQYLQRIASIRSAEGYTLAEVQKAVRIFEEELWAILIKYQPVNERLVNMLVICNEFFGEAKDNLAQVYMAQI
ncbi:hypothetical protein JW935_19055, partial [candidate division KSB1 bacterium]|nr:hypothetical protein [candidate division KSB1 bacterium]